MSAADYAALHVPSQFVPANDGTGFLKIAYPGDNAEYAKQRLAYMGGGIIALPDLSLYPNWPVEAYGNLDSWVRV